MARDLLSDCSSTRVEDLAKPRRCPYYSVDHEDWPLALDESSSKNRRRFRAVGGIVRRPPAAPMSFVIAVPRDSRLQGKLDLIAQVKECVLEPPASRAPTALADECPRRVGLRFPLLKLVHMTSSYN